MLSVVQRPIFSVVALVGLIGLVRGPSAAAAAEEAADWEAQREQLEQLVDTRVEEAAKEAVSRHTIVKKLKWTWPVPKPPKKKDVIVAEVTAEIQELVDERHPLELRDEFPVEAAEKYRLHEQGDDVSFIIRGGRGPYTLVEGKFLSVNEQRVHVGIRWIWRKDMDQEDLARFDKEIQKKYIDRHIRVKNVRYDYKRRSYAERLEKSMLPQRFLAATYIPNVLKQGWKKRVRSTDPEHWVSRHDVVEAFYNQQVEAQKALLHADIEAEVFTSNNFIKTPDGGDWIHKDAVRSGTSKLRQLLQRKKKDDAAGAGGGLFNAAPAGQGGLFGPGRTGAAPAPRPPMTPGPPRPPPAGGGGGGLFNERQ